MVGSLGVPAGLYRRLSSFYFFYFALLGAIVPYWSVYLDSLGMSGEEVGVLMAILMGTRIVAPNLWGWLADRTGRRVWVVRLGSLMTVVIFSAAFWVSSFWGLALLMFGFTFFWNAVLPQFEVLTLASLGENRSFYSRIRLWGSVGFIVAVVLLGWLIDRYSIVLLVIFMWAVMLVIWLSSLSFQDIPLPAPDGVQQGFVSYLCRPPVLAFFAVCFLAQLGHGPYYTFFSLHMADYGYAKLDIGLLWALGVVAEVVIFIYMHRIVGAIGLRQLVLWSMLVCALRWALIALYPDSLPVMLFAQALHAVTFGCLHAAAIALVQLFFPQRCQGQGQALYSSFGFGAGGALGALLSGLLWERFGGASAFWLAAVVSMVGFLVALRWLKLEMRPA